MKFVEENRQKNNRGIALASVLIVMALIGLLASSILNLSYLAYERKLVEKKNTDNFYAAESVIDTVKAELQNLSATALSAATEGTGAFAEAAYEAVVGKDKDTATSADEDAVEAALYDAIIATDPDVAAAISGSEDGVGVDNINDVVTYSDGITTYTYTYKNEAGEMVTSTVEANGGLFEIGDIVIEDSCLRIKDVHVIYVNDEGYTSEITTDIVINAPVYAADEDVPLGTYSMFAGNGSNIESTAYVDYQTQNGHASMGNMLYLHQDGNVYVGAKLNSDNSESTTAFTISGDEGSTFISYGGTNIVFNGDIIIEDENALIFTGGDGTETANIQVNGYIILKEGASLFLPSNCNLVCKGIVTDIEYESEVSGANVSSITYYNGTGAQSTASLFYPFTQSYVAAKSTYYASSYLNNEGDVAKVLGDFTFTDVDFEYLDNQYNAVMDGTTTVGGVYIASTEYTSEGWDRKTTDVYNLLTCTVTSSGSVWNWTDSTGANVSVITCDPSDTKLNQEAKITYNGTVYDAEFAEIMNVHLLSTISQLVQISSYLTNYSDTNESTYSKVTWNEVAPSSVRTTYSTTDTTLQALTPSSIYESLWQYSYTSTFNWEQIYALGYDERDFVIPTSTTTGTIDYSNYKVTKDDGTVYTSASGYNIMGHSSGTINGTNDMLAVLITNNALDVQVNGDYAGLFMSAEVVTFGHSTGIVRGISLLELADETAEYKGITNANNEVRKYLTMLGTALVTKKDEGGSIMYNNAMRYEFAIGENLFNGGVERFWKTGISGDDENDGNKNDNSSLDFVGTENWSKD